MSLYIRLVRFALVGAVCFFVQWGIEHALRQSFHLIAADMVGFALSAQLNFWLSKTITWNDRPAQGNLGLMAVWARFNGVVLLATVVNAVVFWSLDRFGELFALVFAGVVSSSFTFALNHFFVFRGKGHILLPERISINLSEAAQSGVAIFLPAHNEADNLRYVVAGAVSYLHNQRVPFKVIVVDDGSIDATADVVEDLHQTYPEVTLVRHERNLGYGAALRTGFQAALATGYGWIGFCDADGQFKPHDFGKLITHAELSEADICIGYRINRADGLKRRLMGRGWHLASRLMLGYKAIDVDCGFKVFRRTDIMVRLLSQLTGDYATISPEILARAHRAGLRTVEIGVNHYPREFGQQSGADWHVIKSSIIGLTSIRRTLAKETV